MQICHAWRAHCAEEEGEEKRRRISACQISRLQETDVSFTKTCGDKTDRQKMEVDRVEGACSCDGRSGHLWAKNLRQEPIFSLCPPKLIAFFFFLSLQNGWLGHLAASSRGNCWPLGRGAAGAINTSCHVAGALIAHSSAGQNITAALDRAFHQWPRRPLESHHQKYRPAAQIPRCYTDMVHSQGSGCCNTSTFV